MSIVEQALRKIQSLGQGPEQKRSEPVVSAASAPPTASPPSASRESEAVQVNELANIALRPAVPFDQAKFRAAKLLPPPDQERLVMRQMRAIKHGLLRKLSTETPGPYAIPRTVMITSGVSGDGKTFSSLNLVLSLALEKDLNVLYVDADVIKPHISTEFGFAGEPGLIDVLSDAKADVAAFIHPTQVRNLYFMPAGRASEVATELMSSERMTAVVRQCVNLQRNLVVVFDSSPLLITSEAQSIARLMSQVLMVVRAGVTPRSVVQQTLAILANDSRNVSLILNDANELDPSNYLYDGVYGEARRPRASSGQPERNQI